MPVVGGPVSSWWLSPLRRAGPRLGVCRLVVPSLWRVGGRVCPRCCRSPATTASQQRRQRGTGPGSSRSCAAGSSATRSSSWRGCLPRSGGEITRRSIGGNARNGVNRSQASVKVLGRRRVAPAQLAGLEGRQGFKSGLLVSGLVHRFERGAHAPCGPCRLALRVAALIRCYPHRSGRWPEPTPERDRGARSGRPSHDQHLPGLPRLASSAHTPAQNSGIPHGPGAQIPRTCLTPSMSTPTAIWAALLDT